MSDTYRQLKAHTRELEAEAEALHRRELKEVIRTIRQQIRSYGITPDDLFGPDLSDLVQYRDPGTGKTWNGHGRPPAWIRGKDREQFRVDG